MELIIGLIVIAVAGYFVFFRKKEEATVASSVIESAPYNVPEPAATTPIPLAAEAVVANPVTEVVLEAVVEAPTKAPRKPRAPKAEAVAKPAAKKAAPAKKAAVKKAVSKKA